MVDQLCKPVLTLCLTTEANPVLARALARTLLERRLVACVSLLPIQSLYHWQGQLQEEQEVQLLLKTTQDRLKPLQVAIEELHSYETPEWIYWTADSGKAYGDWLISGVNGDVRGQALEANVENAGRAG